MTVPSSDASFARSILDFLRRSGTERSTPRLVGEMFRFIARTFAVERVSLFLASGEKGRLRPYVSEFASGTPDRQMYEDWLGLEPEDFALVQRVRAGETIIEVDDPHDPGGLPLSVVERFGIEPYIGFALRSEGTVHGLLMFEGDPTVLRERHDEAAEFVQYVAMALANARAFEREQQRASDAQALLEVGDVLTRTTELVPVLASVAQNCARVTGFERCSVFLVDDESGALRPVMSQFADGHTDMDAWSRFTSSEGDFPAARRVLRTGNPMAFEDVTEHPAMLPQSWYEPFGVRSMVIVPLTAWDRRFGILVLDRRQRGSIGDQQMRMARGVAAQGAAAIGLTRSLAVEREAAIRLREIDQLKSAFVAAVSHELRTPLTTIIGFGDILAESRLGEETAEFVDIIRRESSQLEGLIANLLVTSQMEGGVLSFSFEPTRLAPIITEAVELVERVHTNRLIHLDLDESLTIERGDPARLRQIFINLIENAAKYSEPETSIRVMARLVDHHHAEVVVEDEGPGIPVADRELIFDRFQRRSGHFQSGTGIGLYLVRALVEAHGGSVHAEDGAAGQGARFVTTLPLDAKGIEAGLQSLGTADSDRSAA